MRVCSCCVLLLLSALGIALGQDTNFSAGPQYLLNLWFAPICASHFHAFYVVH